MSIPKIIHYCWLGGEPPKSALRCIKSWTQYCPDYTIKLWNENNLPLDINNYTKEAYDSHAFGFVPDYLRLWIIYNYGGVYLDTDVQMVKSFDPLLAHGAFAGMEYTESRLWVSLGLGFGSEPHNPLICELMHAYDQLHYINPDGSFNRVSSPRYSTKIFERHGFDIHSMTIQQIQTFTIYPPEYFCPKSFETGCTNLTQNTYSIHQFDASWFTEEQQKAKLDAWAKFRKERRIKNRNALAKRLVGERAYQNLRKIFRR